RYTWQRLAPQPLPRDRPSDPAGPLVTVALVCRNAAAVIEDTLKTIHGQTWPRRELVVVDGGSTDGTLDILGRHRDRIDRLVSEPDKGVYDAMNKAARLGRGDYVVFINAGDGFHRPEALETALG